MNDITVNSRGGKQARINCRLDLIDPLAIIRLGEVLEEGLHKYGKDNWRLIPVGDHLNHALYHIYQHLANDDKEDHLAHAFCRLMFALALVLAESKNE